MLSYEKLLEKYNALINENKELRNQVNQLKIKLGMPIEIEAKTIVDASNTAINKYSSADEKILLYRSLFHGREDVFCKAMVQ